MLTLALGLLVFFAIHLVPIDSDIRGGLVGRLGEGPYKLVFSLLAGLGLVPHEPPSIADTEQFLKAEATRWGAILKSMGLAGSI